jgi:site-specific DNA recombinase
MAHHYPVQVDELYAALQEDSEAKRMAAADLIWSLVREIILTPENGALQIWLESLRYRLKAKGPPGGGPIASWLRGHATTDTDIR